MVAFEDRQGTLDMAARGRGLTARRRGRTQGRKEGKKKGRKEGRTTSDIKSNNPHLTGGEKEHTKAPQNSEQGVLRLPHAASLHKY